MEAAKTLWKLQSGKSLDWLLAEYANPDSKLSKESVITAIGYIGAVIKKTILANQDE